MLCIILGILFLAAGIYLLADWFRYQKRCTEKVLSTVTAIEHTLPGKSSKNSRSCYPVYSFVYQDRNYEVRPKEPSRANRWKVDELVELRIDPKEPECFLVGRGLSDLIYGLIAMLLFLLMVGILLFG